jgi:hypothetical protein
VWPSIDGKWLRYTRGKTSECRFESVSVAHRQISEVTEIVADPPRRALQVLARQIGADRVQLFGDRIHVRSDSALSSESLTASLGEAGIVVADVRTITPTLEDVFIERLMRASDPETGREAHS